jgi:hypothetical protein
LLLPSFLHVHFVTPKFSPQATFMRTIGTMDLPRKASTEEQNAACEIKELFIEACVREWRPEYFSEFVSPNNLLAMSMLDPSALKDLKEAGAPLHSAPDLFSSLRHEMSLVRREKWLTHHLRIHLQDEDFRNKVDAQFDGDLRDARLPHLAGGGGKMVDKASIQRPSLVGLS